MSSIGSDESVADLFFLSLDGLKLECLDQEYCGDIKPFEHQVATERLIKDEDCKSLFLFNHSPTGSGKTLSWLKPVLDEKMKVVAVYPTNALVIDQEKQVKKSIKKYGYDSRDYHVQAVTSDLLDEERELYPDEVGLRKGQLLNRVIQKGKRRGLILLTNPDILTLALKGAYRDHNLREAVRSVDMIVVDEFHLASVKQSDMLLFMMHEIEDDMRSSLSKFIFLSATPNQKIVERVKKAGLNVEVLNDTSTPLSSSEGQPVLPKLNLEVRRGSIYKTYELIKEDLDYFIDFCKRPRRPDGRKAKTVLIVDGIYEVDEIFKCLSDALRGFNFQVERVDGLHPATPNKLSDFDVLVSNSSVEVGIDFNVDRLVFTGYSKSSLLQRIGRLRNKPQKEVCDAICFVPETVFDHLKGQGESMTREELVRHLGRVMDSEIDLSSYSKTYSPLEAFLYLSSRIRGDVWIDKSGREHHKKGMPEQIQREEWKRTLTLIGKHFFDGEIDDQRVNYLMLESLKLRKGLTSYRGDSLQALMFDKNDSQLKLYDLMYLLRRGKVEFMSPQSFARRLRATLGEDYESIVKPKYEARKPFAAGFCWYEGTIDEPRKVVFNGDSTAYKGMMFNSVDHARKPRMVSGFAVETEPNIPSLYHLNETLSEFEIFARLVDQNSFTLKAKFNLGDFFYLYPYSGMRSVCFGHNALYIDCLIKEEYARRR